MTRLGAQLAACALVIGGLWLGYYRVTAHHDRVGYERGVKELTQKIADSVAKAIEEERASALDLRRATEKVHGRNLVRVRAQLAAKQGSADELAALQRLLSAAARGDAAGDENAADAARRLTHEAATLRGLFGACAGEVEAVAGDAGILAAQVIGLQDYLRANKIVGDSPAGAHLRTGVIAPVTQPATGLVLVAPTEAAPPTP